MVPHLGQTAIVQVGAIRLNVCRCIFFPANQSLKFNKFILGVDSRATIISWYYNTRIAMMNKKQKRFRNKLVGGLLVTTALTFVASFFILWGVAKSYEAWQEYHQEQRIVKTK